jgi:hypothetical protein
LVPVLIHVCGRYLLLSTLVECGAGQQVGSLRAMLKPSGSPCPPCWDVLFES